MERSHFHLGTTASPEKAESQKAASDSGPSGRLHSELPSVVRCVLSTVPHLYPASLARAVLQEIRNLFSRIREIQETQIHRRGVSIDPLGQIACEGQERERAIIDCSSDMRNLYARRPHTTLIEAEIFAQGWRRGAVWAENKKRNKLPA